MSYYRQFDHFHPLKGRPAAVPIPALWDIAQRARKVLPQGTTVEQVISIAATINWIIDGAVAIASSHAEENDGPFVRRDDRHDTHWLRDLIFRYEPDANRRSDFPGYHQCFAVLALWKIADASFCIEPELGKSAHGALKNSPVAIQWLAAANYAIDATEAVCVAENLYARDLGERISASIESTLPSTEELVREKLSLRAKQAAIKKHAGNHAARARVIELYRMRAYPSVEAAAQAIAPLVFKAPRTVSKWLYDERKGRTPQLPRVTD
ncbi:MAG: hypothetical protein WCH13_16465 [Deltaproteobacteria bacterium]